MRFAGNLTNQFLKCFFNNFCACFVQFPVRVAANFKPLAEPLIVLLVSASCHYTLFYGSACCRESIFNSMFLFLHFSFRRGSYLNNSDSSREFCQSLLQFFTVEIEVVSSICDLIDAIRPLISSVSPAPSTIMVFSFWTTTLAARPN